MAPISGSRIRSGLSTNFRSGKNRKRTTSEYAISGRGIERPLTRGNGSKVVAARVPEQIANAPVDPDSEHDPKLLGSLVGLHHSMLDRVSDQVRGGVEGEFLFEILAMDLSGFGTDSEPLRHLLAGRSLPDQAQHFPLTLG